MYLWRWRKVAENYKAAWEIFPQSPGLPEELIFQSFFGPQLLISKKGRVALPYSFQSIKIGRACVKFFNTVDRGGGYIFQLSRKICQSSDIKVLVSLRIPLVFICRGYNRGYSSHLPLGRLTLRWAPSDDRRKTQLNASVSDRRQHFVKLVETFWRFKPSASTHSSSPSPLY